jgi:hypothetical protein
MERKNTEKTRRRGGQSLRLNLRKPKYGKTIEYQPINHWFIEVIGHLCRYHFRLFYEVNYVDF